MFFIVNIPDEITILYFTHLLPKKLINNNFTSSFTRITRSNCSTILIYIIVEL